MRLKLVILVVFLLLPCVLLFGQAKVGTSGAQFLELGVSARAIAMGEAFIAVADDATALYYNPAGLTQLYDREVVFTHIDYPADISFEFAGLAYPLYGFGGVLGVGVYMLNAGDIYETTYEYPLGTGRIFGVREYAATLSYGRNLTDRFSVGVTLKFIDELYEDERASGWAADVGTSYDTGFRGFRISMAITNFGPDMTFITEAHPLPINFKFGGAINVLDGDVHRAILALEGWHPSDNLEKYNTGFEYQYHDRYFLRMGHKFHYDTGGFAFGGGLKLPLSSLDLRVDYGFQDLGDLSDAHRFTLAFRF